MLAVETGGTARGDKTDLPSGCCVAVRWLAEYLVQYLDDRVDDFYEHEQGELAKEVLHGKTPCGKVIVGCFSHLSYTKNGRKYWIRGPLWRAANLVGAHATLLDQRS